MGKALLDFGMQLGQSAIGAGMGILLGKQADQRQITQQRKLQDMQIQGQQQMMDYSYGKQLQMWKDTNFGAQKEMLKAAGLNPALLYGMGGGGGTTTGGAGTNVAGGTAPTGGGEPMQMAGMAMNIGLLRAQKENIEADTANKRAEIPVKEGTVPKLAAETANIKIQTKIAEIEKEIKGATIEEAIQTAVAQMGIMQQEVMQQEVKTQVERSTQQTQVLQIKASLAATLLANELTRAQTTTEKGKPAVQKAEIKYMQDNIQNTILGRMQQWVAMEQTGKGLAQNEINSMNNEIQNATRLPIEIIEKVMQAIFLKKIMTPTATPNRIGYK